MWFQSRFGTPPWMQLAGMLELRDVLRRVLLTPHLGARDTLERLLDLRELVVDDRLVAVEREAHDPAADLELARDPVDHRRRESASSPSYHWSRRESTEPSTSVL